MVKEQDSTNDLFKNEENEPSIFDRKLAKFEDCKERFSQPVKDFSNQFFHAYLCRLAELKKAIIPRATKRWGNVQIVSLAELENCENEKSIIIGTLFKHQVWKPSILRELREEAQEDEDASEKHENYCSEKDTVFLEDEMLRIKIVGDKIDLSEIVTGVVCALLGKKLDDGTFQVEDCCFPGCCLPNKTLPPPSDGKILLLSGLELANKSSSSLIPLNLLVEWVTGMAGTLAAQEEASSIVDILIAGNSVKSTQSGHDNIRELMSSKVFKANDAEEITSGIKKLDKLLAEILEYSSVVLMPGEHDPTNLMLPQKPIHRLMLKESNKFGSFKGVCNPWVGNIGNRVIAGSSGQPIDDIIRVSGNESFSPIQWMEKTLEWRQYCPTAPDTLPSYPYNNKDLFIMQECPDIYFVGNTEKFETKLWKGDDGQSVRIVCIPKFSTTSTAVLIDLKSLEANPINFGAF